MRRFRLSRVLVVVATVLLAAPGARADGTADARALYDQGAAAYDAGEFARAAALLGDADALSPNPMVLGLAVHASTRAGDAVLAEELALRADARGATGDLASAATQAHERFRTKVGRVRIVCASASPCTARLGATRWSGGDMHAVAPGTVDVVFDGSPAHVRIDVAEGITADLVQPPVSLEPRALAMPIVVRPVDALPSSEARGLAPWVFWAGVAITAGLGGATGVSAADTQSRHDDFVASRTSDTQRAGESAQLRTNALLVGTIASAVAVAAVGVFFTRWRAPVLAASLASGLASW